jgi:hypothetical protein
MVRVDDCGRGVGGIGAEVAMMVGAAIIVILVIMS